MANTTIGGNLAYESNLYVTMQTAEQERRFAIQNLIQGGRLFAWHLPDNNEFTFVERSEEFEKLYASLRTTERILKPFQKVIIGLGGVGKTELAIWYAYHPGCEYTFVAWFDASSTNSLRGDYYKIARQYKLLPIDDQTTEEEILLAIQLFLDNIPNSLVIYDNACSYKELKGNLLNKNGHLLVTTRHQDWNDVCEKLDVDIFSPDEAFKYMTKIIPIASGDENNIKKLSLELGCLPLALAQAGTYIKQTGATVSEYREEYKNKKDKLLANKRLPANSKSEPVATTWNISLEAIQKDEEKDYEPFLSIKILQAMACLNSNYISKELLVQYIIQSKLCENTNEAISMLNNAIGHLKDYSLVKANVQEGSYSLHCLLQEVIREQHEKEDGANFVVTLSTLIDMCLKEAEKENINFDELRKSNLIEHLFTLQYQVTLVRENITDEVVHHTRVMRLAYNIATFSLEVNSMPRYAKVIFETAFFIAVNNNLHITWLGKILAGLGNSYVALGDYPSAYLLLDNALKINSENIGSESCEALEIMSEICRIKQYKQKYSLGILLTTLEAQKKRYGDVHWKISKTLLYISDMFGKLGNIERQKSFLYEAYKIRNKLYGVAASRTIEVITRLIKAYFLEKDERSEDVITTNFLELLKIILPLEYWVSKEGFEFSEVFVQDSLATALKIKILEYVLELLSNRFGSKHAVLEMIEFNLSRAYVDKVDYVQSYNHLQKAYQVACANDGNNETLDKMLDTFRELARLIDKLCCQEVIEYLQNGNETAVREKFVKENIDLRNSENYFRIIDYYEQKNKPSYCILYFEFALRNAGVDGWSKDDIEILYSRLANFYFFSGCLDQRDEKKKLVAEEYFKKAELYYQKSANGSDLSYSHSVFGLFLFHRNDFLNAIREFNLSINLEISTITFTMMDYPTLEPNLQSELIYWKRYTLDSRILAHYIIVLSHLKLNLPAAQLVSNLEESIKGSVQALEFSLLGRVYLALEDSREALKNFEKALALEPKYTLVEELIKKIKNVPQELKEEIDVIELTDDYEMKKSGLWAGETNFEIIMTNMTLSFALTSRTNTLCRKALKLYCEREYQASLENIERISLIITLLYINHAESNLKLIKFTRDEIASLDKGLNYDNIQDQLSVTTFLIYLGFRCGLQWSNEEKYIDYLEKLKIHASDPLSKNELKVLEYLISIASMEIQDKSNNNSNSSGYQEAVYSSEETEGPKSTEVVQADEKNNKEDLIKRDAAIALQLQISEYNKNQVKEIKHENEITASGGDCTFHAIFGKSKNGIIYCDNVSEKRKITADAIRGCQQNSPMLPLVAYSIQALLMGEGHGLEELRQEYRTYLESHEKLLDECWNKFEEELKSRKEILEYIESSVKERKASDLDKVSFKQKFQYCLNLNDGLLYGLILSVKELQEYFMAYNNKSQEEFNLVNRILGNRKILEEYAQFIERPGQWLLPSELHIVAQVFNITVNFYTYNPYKKITTGPEIFNPNQQMAVEVHFNGYNHFEQRNKIYPVILKNGSNNSDTNLNYSTQVLVQYNMKSDDNLSGFILSNETNFPSSQTNVNPIVCPLPNNNSSTSNPGTISPSPKI